MHLFCSLCRSPRGAHVPSPTRRRASCCTWLGSVLCSVCISTSPVTQDSPPTTSTDPELSSAASSLLWRSPISGDHCSCSCDKGPRPRANCSGISVNAHPSGTFSIALLWTRLHGRSPTTCYPCGWPWPARGPYPKAQLVGHPAGSRQGFPGLALNPPTPLPPISFPTSPPGALPLIHHYERRCVASKKVTSHEGGQRSPPAHRVITFVTKI